jgi:uncharacterized protein
VENVRGANRMKQVYLIHGWGGNDSSEGWFGFVKSELSNNGFKVTGFNMPDTDSPTIQNWVGFLEKNIKRVDKDTYFIGHSIGCQTIMRYLEKLPERVKIGGAIFVAGWFNLMDMDENEEKIAMPWIEGQIDFERVKKHTNNFLAIFSNNDPYVPLSNSNVFQEKLNAEIVIKDNEGHFNETLEIKEIIDFIKKEK